jgi:hypothetical protein
MEACYVCVYEDSIMKPTKLFEKGEKGGNGNMTEG